MGLTRRTLRPWRQVPLVLLLALTARTSHAAPTEEAKKSFSAGVILLQDPDGARYDEALVQFRRAYELSHSWKVLGNLGLCLMKLERDGEAIAAYEKYLAEGKTEITADERQQVERDLSATRAQAVRVRLDYEPGGATMIDERTTARGTKVRNTYELTGSSAELVMHPGDHVIVVKSSRGDEARWETALVPAGASAHKFVFGNATSEAGASGAGAAPAASGRSTLMPVGLVVGGVGVVSLAVGTVFALKRSSKLNERDGVCPTTINCTDDEIAQNAALSDDARSAAQIATIGLVAGGILLTTGVVLVVSSKKSATSTGIYIAPSVGTTTRGIALGGSF